MQINTNFKISNPNRKALPKHAQPLGREIWHICTITGGLREYVLLQDRINPKDIWLNEVDGISNVKEIEDEELFKDLWKYLYDLGFITATAI